jgi:hypothetical protein
MWLAGLAVPFLNVQRNLENLLCNLAIRVVSQSIAKNYHLWFSLKTHLSISTASARETRSVIFGSARRGHILLTQG